MPPHITEYLDFVEDKSLFHYMKNGDIIIDPKMSTTLGKMYLYINWEKYIRLGNSPSTLWNAMASIKNDIDPIRFDNNGYQINKKKILELDMPHFMGLMAEEYKSKYWFGWFKIGIYVILVALGIYFVKNLDLSNSAWVQLISLSQINPFS